MNESGYNKMITVLKEYIKTSKQEYIDNLDENNKIK